MSKQGKQRYRERTTVVTFFGVGNFIAGSARFSDREEALRAVKEALESGRHQRAWVAHPRHPTINCYLAPSRRGYGREMREEPLGYAETH